MMRRVTLSAETKTVNSILNSVKKTDEGEGQYVQLPIFQKGAHSDNQDPVWKTRNCMHWDNLTLGCGMSDKCTYLHQGYDYKQATTGKVWASEEAMSYNLENKMIDSDTWRKIKASIPKSWCHANKREADDKWKGQQLTELWVRLTDAEAAKRTEDSFNSSPCIIWTPPPQPPQPPRLAHDDRKRDWDGSDRAHAKHARHEDKSGPWSGYAPAWKEESTWTAEKPKAYDEKWSSWKDDEHSRNQAPQKEWHWSTPQKGVPSSYLDSSAPRDEQSDIREAVENSMETIAAELAKMKELKDRLR